MYSVQQEIIILKQKLFSLEDLIQQYSVFSSKFQDFDLISAPELQEFSILENLNSVQKIKKSSYYDDLSFETRFIPVSVSAHSEMNKFAICHDFGYHSRDCYGNYFYLYPFLKIEDKVCFGQFYHHNLHQVDFQMLPSNLLFKPTNCLIFGDYYSTERIMQTLQEVNLSQKLIQKIILSLQEYCQQIKNSNPNMDRKNSDDFDQSALFRSLLEFKL